VKWDAEPRWAPGEGGVRCPRCQDAGFLRVWAEKPWELRPKDTLVPCPCRYPSTDPGEPR
jgi:hypothetical protein